MGNILWFALGHRRHCPLYPGLQGLLSGISTHLKPLLPAVAWPRHFHVCQYSGWRKACRRSHSDEKSSVICSQKIARPRRLPRQWRKPARTRWGASWHRCSQQHSFSCMARRWKKRVGQCGVKFDKQCMRCYKDRQNSFSLVPRIASWNVPPQCLFI